MDINLRKEDNYTSKLYKYLAALTDNEIFSAKHNLKHPADILSDQIKFVYQDFLSLIENIIDDRITGTHIKNIFQVVDTFYDNCFNIIKTLKPPTDINEIVVKKWLKNSGYIEGENFYQKTNTHHKFISNINNKLKHDNISIRVFDYTYTKSRKKIKSFFIGSIIKDDKIGPDPSIHKHFNNQRTGFSFNFIIRKLICHIFFYEYILWKILLSKRENCSSYTDNNIHSNLFDLEKRLDNIYLPNEYSIPSGKFSETLKSKLIEFPKMKCLKNKRTI